MVVYVKNELGKSKVVNLISWVIMSLFAIMSPVMLFNILTGKQQYSSFIEAVGMVILMCGILVAYIRMIIKPTRYNLRLVSKIREEYNGKMITSMVFSGLNSKDISCYTIGDNEFEIDQKYLVIISKFDGLPIRVENN